MFINKDIVIYNIIPYLYINNIKNLLRVNKELYEIKESKWM